MPLTRSFADGLPSLIPKTPAAYVLLSLRRMNEVRATRSRFAKPLASRTGALSTKLLANAVSFSVAAPRMCRAKLLSAVIERRYRKAVDLAHRMVSSMSAPLRSGAIVITNPNAVLYPGGRSAKRGDQFNRRVAKFLLPHFGNRPIMLKRFLNGAHDEFRSWPATTKRARSCSPAKCDRGFSPALRKTLFNELAPLAIERSPF